MNTHVLRHKSKNFFNVVMKDPERKNLAFLLTEYLRLSLSDPLIADQYFPKFMYRKNAGPFTDYVVSERLLPKIWGLNSREYISIVEDKYLFERFFLRHKIRVVNSLAVNYNSLFFRDDKLYEIDSPELFRNFLKSLIPKESRSDSFIIKKISGSSGGRSIFRIRFGELDSDPEKMGRIYSEILKSEFMIQEFVNQHELINKINPDCLNTMRMDTFTNREGKSRVYSAFLRMGQNKAHVDNVGSGGIYVGINLDEGTLLKTGFSDFSHGGGKHYTHYPGTGLQFEGYSIPYFRESVEMVTKAASLVPQLKVLGWDVGISEDGTVVIEANDTPGIPHSEIANGGFRGNPVVKEILEEIGHPLTGRQLTGKEKMRLSDPALS